MNSLFRLACMHSFCLPIKLPLSQPTGFLTLTLLILSPIPPWGGKSERLCGAELLAGVKPRHCSKTGRTGTEDTGKSVEFTSTSFHRELRCG